MLRLGLNPYGLTYTLGLQGQGTPRANPRPGGLDEFVALAREHGARTLELDWRWLMPLSDPALARVGRDAAASDMAIVVSAWLRHEPGETLDEPLRVAKGTGAELIRLHLTPVLEGARAALGARWLDMAAHAARTLVTEAPKAWAAGLRIGIENHQDFGSEELLTMATAAGDHVGIVFDTGNPFAVGEDPVAFARRIAGRVWHVHLKDYRAQFTDEGYRLIRCAIGDGAVPLADLVGIVASGAAEVTASVEPAALEARHIRLLTADWWTGYGPREAKELATALGRLRLRKLGEDDDARTPWERHAEPEEIVRYELDQLSRSVAFARGL